jgi:hypothetical protein
MLNRQVAIGLLVPSCWEQGKSLIQLEGALNGRFPRISNEKR